MQFGLRMMAFLVAYTCYCSHDVKGFAESLAPKPNIVILLADDLGYGDLGCFGNRKIQTSNIDTMASQGMRLTDCYAAAPMCSPSRAGLLTGRSPHRTGIFDWIAHDGTTPVHLRRDEITIATLLQNAGYETAIHGKWHLNSEFNTETQPQPDDQGFGYWFATQFNPPHLNPFGFVRNGRPLPPQPGYSCQIVVDDAIHWLSKDRDSTKPFFQFISFHEPHHPVASPPALVDTYLGRITETEEEAVYFANVHNLDLATGRYLKALTELELAEETLMIFTSDHGPQTRNPGGIFRHSYGSVGPFCGRKRHLWEGGIRVPCVVRWLGRIEPGSKSDTPVGFVDALPTFAALAGCDVPDDRPLDGVDLSPLFRGDSLKRTIPLHWHFYDPLSGPQSVLRDGDWVLGARWDIDRALFRGGTRRIPGFESLFKQAELTDFRLFDIRADPHQDFDIATRQPEVVGRLKSQLIRIHAEVRDEAPLWAEVTGAPK